MRVINSGLEPTGKYYVAFDMDADIFEQWFQDVYTKLVLQARNRNQLLKAVELAADLGMHEGEDYFLIKDICRTELTPEEIDENGVGWTLTCIGFRPMDEEVIDQIGRKYHLFT